MSINRVVERALSTRAANVRGTHKVLIDRNTCLISPFVNPAQ